ncbi:MAG: enolase C-terminal domain-like protein [Thermomicrobiales bacterium]
MTSGLRITEVERITLLVPFRPRVEPWLNLLNFQWGIVEICRVVTDAGFVGYGETLPHYTYGKVTDAAVERVTGKNPADFLSEDSLGAGLQMALWDVVGKALGVPVHKLLGNPKVRDWAPIAWWTTKAPPEIAAAEAADAVREGYLAHKFKARPWFDVFEAVKLVSEATPPGFKIDVDWNGLLVNAGNAIPVLTELDKNPKVAIYESPIPHDDIEGYQKIRSHIKNPLAIHFGGMPSFSQALESQMCDGFVVHNGVSEILRKGALAAAFNKPFWLQMVGPGLTTALSAQLGSVLTHAQWPAISMNIYSDDHRQAAHHCRWFHQGSGRTRPRRRVRRIGDCEVPHGAAVRNHGAEAHSVSEGFSGRTVHLIWEVWAEEFQKGHLPAQEPGVRMHVSFDDGTPEWADLFARASQGAVYDLTRP